MSSQIQLVMYEGYLARSPEMRYTANDKTVTNFRMASNNEYISNGEKVKETIWLKVTVWGKLAEIVNNYCEKGSHVIVTGRLRANENGNPNEFELKAGGYGSSFEVVANQVRILSKKDIVTELVSDEDDDLPF